MFGFRASRASRAFRAFRAFRALRAFRAFGAFGVFRVFRVFRALEETVACFGWTFRETEQGHHIDPEGCISEGSREEIRQARHSAFGMPQCHLLPKCPRASTEIHATPTPTLRSLYTKHPLTSFRASGMAMEDRKYGALDHRSVEGQHGCQP